MTSSDYGGGGEPLDATLLTCLVPCLATFTDPCSASTVPLTCPVYRMNEQYRLNRP